MQTQRWQSDKLFLTLWTFDHKAENVSIFKGEFLNSQETEDLTSTAHVRASLEELIFFLTHYEKLKKHDW